MTFPRTRSIPQRPGALRRCPGVRTPRANVVFMYEEHVSIDRLWAFVRSGEELDTNERRHLDKCSYCVCALGLCIISDGPSAVEKKLREQFEGDEK
jgi:hypothetical protein